MNDAFWTGVGIGVGMTAAGTATIIPLLAILWLVREIKDDSPSEWPAGIGPPEYDEMEPLLKNRKDCPYRVRDCNCQGMGGDR